MLDALAHELDTAFAPLAPEERLKTLRQSLPGKLVFTSSLGIEDQLLTAIIAEAGLDITIATLDTGRLFPETYALWTETEARYQCRIVAHYPDRVALEALVAEQGIDGFRDSIEARKACCDVRKIEPLERALAGAGGWITGLRADQSANRGAFHFVEIDRARGLIKANPLLDWSRERVREEARRRNVPVNPLHEQGFLSIGCAPCTRAISPGEPERAGRWWWEQEAQKECGLHVGADGKLTRGNPAEASA
ncbi:MAG: phosphoadenylyl-sulfate reductase [Proteobacteria bacterium]|nr:phosphoadenylyl-sulfate reductase [Pseudomonadota bacterium]